MSKEKKWTMPKWMEPYRPMLDNLTGGNSVEEMQNDATPFQINAPRALIACSVHGAINLLYQMHEKGVLK